MGRAHKYGPGKSRRLYICRNSADNILEYRTCVNYWNRKKTIVIAVVP